MKGISSLIQKKNTNTIGKGVMISYSQYLHLFDKQVNQYLPQEKVLSTVDRIIYQSENIFRPDRPDYELGRFQAIKETFTLHYTKNRPYRELCELNKINPDLINEPDDLYRIPLIPHSFFKLFPPGADCAVWIGNIFTGPMSEVFVSKNDDIDNVIKSFEKAGVKISCSSGTSGKITMVPRDITSFRRNEYILAKSLVSMSYPFWSPEIKGLLLMPDPESTCLNIGRVCEIFRYAVSEVKYAVDRSITVSDIVKSGADKNLLKQAVYSSLLNRYLSKVIQYTIRWLKTQDSLTEKIVLIGPPFLYSLLFKKLKQDGLKFDFSGRSGVITGGGWKNEVQHEISGALFREEVRSTLGCDLVLDVYGMAEGNIWGIHCPEGHYFHLTSGFALPVVLNEDGKVLPYGKEGRFAYLDASVTSYPAFILTDDRVTMYEHCPVCRRPGPVLDPVITRFSHREHDNCISVMQKELTREK